MDKIVIKKDPVRLIRTGITELAKDNLDAALKIDKRIYKILKKLEKK